MHSSNIRPNAKPKPRFTVRMEQNFSIRSSRWISPLSDPHRRKATDRAEEEEEKAAGRQAEDRGAEALAGTRSRKSKGDRSRKDLMARKEANVSR